MEWSRGVMEKGEQNGKGRKGKGMEAKEKRRRKTGGAFRQRKIYDYTPVILIYLFAY